MAHQPDPDRAPATGGSDGTGPGRDARDRTLVPGAATGTAENIHIRNHDHQRGYDLEVAVATPDGDPVFYRQYYLQPGAALSECGLLPDGEYELRVVLDDSREETRQCRIGPSSDRTAVVEVGNGVLSLTEGLHS